MAKQLNAIFVQKALLQANYFPSQKRDNVEIPPVFSTEALTLLTAKAVHGISMQRKCGFDLVAYRVTRHNNIQRIMSIPHPKPYVDLVFTIFNHWKEIKYICENDKSLIVPRRHKDGRLIIMDYERPYFANIRIWENSFAKRFRVKTDISSCYSSIYSHAVPWALVGFNTAKKAKYDSRRWFNKVDKCQMMLCRNETSGLPIGPATSNILVEAILERVDNKLQDYTYCRYIDDFTGYFETHEKAKKFILKLSIELESFKLRLNEKKTTIEELPIASCSDWILSLQNHFPAKTLHRSDVIRFFDYAVNVQKNNPDESVLKYATKMVIGREKTDAAIKACIQYILQLSFYYPVLVSLLDKPLTTSLFDGRRCPKQLNDLLKDSINYRRSDVMCWILFYMLRHNMALRRDEANGIVETEDAFTLTLLSLFQEHTSDVVAFAEQIDSNDPYELDQYWILRYQLYYKGLLKKKKISQKYELSVFDIMKNHGVSFLKLIWSNHD